MIISFRSPEFSLTQAAIDQMQVIRDDYLKQFPQDPPVLAGIATGYQLGSGHSDGSQIIIGFWRRSEVSEDSLKTEKVVKVADMTVLFSVLGQFRPLFLDAAIDYSPTEAFVLRKMPPS